MMAKRKKGRKKRRVRYECPDEGAVRSAAANCDFELLVTYMLPNRRARQFYPHWRFVRDGREVLHYWPSSGTWWIPGGGKGKADPHDALLRAREAVGEADREDQEQAERRWGLG